ncbi:MAG: metallophosphoesterase [Hyphomicrobiaceae bacterium]|nr:metallophosphoesterase [Hyphomicrobiaceae bacterium]
MRCHYMSDLHLEAQDFTVPLPSGDVLILAGDLCHATCLDPARTDRYHLDQRARVLRFLDRARASFPRILLVPGNHEPYDGLLEHTVPLLRSRLDGITVLDDESIDISGVTFFGGTLWSDFDGRDAAAMARMRRRLGEYFFVRTRVGTAAEAPRRFEPEDALAAHDKTLAALATAVAAHRGGPFVVVTHHAPSRLGLDPRMRGNGLDAAYASDLDGLIEALDDVSDWVHGHTHIAASYRIGRTQVRTNALGFAARGMAARGFCAMAHFNVC